MSNAASLREPDIRHLRLVEDDEQIKLDPEFVPVSGVKWLYTRNGIYYLVRKVNGRRIARSLKTRDRKEALRLYRQLVGEEQPILNGKARVPEAWKSFLTNAEKAGKKPATIKAYEDTWRFAESLFGGNRVIDVDVALIERILDTAELYVSPRTGETLSIASLRKIKRNLSAFFKACTKEPTRYRSDNPVAGTRKRIWERQQGEDISQEIDEGHVIADWELPLILGKLGDRKCHHVYRRATCLELMWHSGLRVNEALALLDSDIVDDGGDRFGPYGALRVAKQIAFGAKSDDPTTWFSTLKGRPGQVGKSIRYVCLSKEGRAMLDAYIERGKRERWLQDGGLLFPTDQARPYSSARLQNHFKKAGERANITRPLKTHMLRHSFATRMFGKGASTHEVAEALGNSEGVVSEVYVHYHGAKERSARQAMLVA
jgi:site-specific recombinase XerD